jgi:hypothetical protein
MAADKRAIDFGKIKRYIKNRTAEFYIKSIDGAERSEFESKINYLDNVTKTKHLSKEYTVQELEKIKNKLNYYAPTKDQLKQIKAVNKSTRDENTRIKQYKLKRSAEKRVVTAKNPYESISHAFRALKNLLEEHGKLLTSKEIEIVKKNLIYLAKQTDTTLQERIKYEIQLAYKQAEELKSEIEKLNSKIKNP